MFIKTKHFCGALIAAILVTAAFNSAQAAEKKMHHQHLLPKTAELITKLQEGGHILVFRHERTNIFTMDRKDYEIKNCSSQRNLSVAGTANAVETGKVIKFLKIPIGEVFASPMCRTLETARLLFGKVQPNADLHGAGQDPSQVKASVEQLVINSAGKDGNTAFVTHLGNYTYVFGGHLREGDAAVLTVQDGKPKYLGTIPANAWNDVIIQAASQDNHTHKHKD